MSKFAWEKLETPFFAMAPMAGITDRPFLKIVKTFGADVLFSEMISADGIYFKSKKTTEMMSFDETERPYVIQIFGNDPEKMAYATRFIADNLKPDGIDINMGCPAKKVVGSGNGSALLQDFDLALENAEAVRNATKLPVSVKMRLGWENFEILDFVKNLEGIGIDAVTIHARTKKQGFKGEPSWDAIGRIKQEIKIPVIGNGSVVDLQSSTRIIKETGCDGVMVGRGALGNPWIFRSLKKSVEYIPELHETIKVLMVHTKLNVEEYGESKGILNMRKHYGWYVRGFAEAGLLRKELVQASDLSEVESIFKKFNYLK